MADSLHANRGFEVQHQRVVLDVDFDSKTINASCFLTVLPRNPALRTIYLSAAPALDIHRVSLSSPTLSNPFFDTPATYTLSCLFTDSPMMDARDHPAIKRKTWEAIDEADNGELAISVSGGWIRLVEGEGRLAPLEVRIDYRVSSGQGVHFDDDQVYVTGEGRFWTPCIDSIWSRCTWELIFVVPQTRLGRMVTVASSGELLEQTVHPHTSAKSIFSHLQTIPTTVRHIGFLITTADISQVDDRIIAFGEASDLGFCSRAMLYYTTEFGTYPYQDFKIAFVHDLPAVVVYACVVLVPSDLTCDPSIIEASIEIRETLSLALAKQWIGINVIPRDVSDTWVVNGLALHIRSMCLRHLFGNNDYRYRLKKDIDRCVRLDQGAKSPICVPGSTSLDIEFVNLKAPLVLHILDRYLAKSGTTSGLSRIIPRIFLSALSDELGHGNSLSTPQFLRICRKVTSLDLTSFADQWVFGNRCPHFKIGANFIRKKFLVEMTIVQVKAIVEGSLTIRIHEADGAPFEHIVDVKQPSKTFNLPFNTKYKRTRRSGKVAARFQHLQEQLEADEVVPIAAETFAYPPWESEDARQEWRVSDWSEDQAGTMVGEGGGYEWIRIDPECEWLAWFEFPERPWYWVSQLQGDRDVAAQLQNMTNHLFPVVASELAKVALVKSYYYRVRMEAVRALVAFNCAEADYMGSFLLLKLLNHFRQERNDFSDMPEYFVANAVFSALGDLKTVPAKTALIEALQSNDNSKNPFDDSYRLATIIASLGNCPGDHLRRETNDIVDRLLTMDRLVPSYRNLVTQSGLLTLMKAILGGQRLNDPRPFLSYTREGSILAVRELALDCLLMCRPPGRSQNITDFVLQIVRQDAYPSMRRHAGYALSEAILVSLSLGEIMVDSGEPDDLLIVRTLRRELSRRAGLKDGIDSILFNRAQFDISTQLALLKVAELVCRGQAEISVSNVMPEAPKIRLSMAQDYVPPVTPKITLKKAPVAQKQGLEDADLLAISNALKKLWPVDPIRDQVPDYPMIVTSPMDLSTIGAKLDNGVYRTRAEFVQDVRLIIANCKLYNQPVSPIYASAEAFEAYFNSLWARTETTLSHVSRSEANVEAPSTIKSKAQPMAPPMAPPPVPPKRAVEKRKSAVDDFLGAELDAIEGQTAVEPKRPKVTLSVPRSVPQAASQPAPTAKQTPSRPVTTVKQMPSKPAVEAPFRQRRAKALLGVLEKDPNAYIFLQPVNPVADQCPTYLDEIKHPMDLGTIKQKTDKHSYSSMADLASDIELIFTNCRTFNREGPIVDLADNLEGVYRKEWPKVLSPKLTTEEKKAVAALINRGVKEKSSFFFREPVDPVKHKIPNYFEIIPQEDARDLSLIRRKLNDGSYSTMGEVDDAVKLMLDNARMFNEDGPVVVQANEFGSWWKAQRSKMDV